MKKFYSYAFAFLTVLVGLTGFQTEAKAETQYVTIGTGGSTGVYYQVGSAICKLVSRQKDLNINCSPETTGGSAFNLNAIRAGEMDIGVAQSDAQYNALNGLTNKFEDKGPFNDLRALFSVHSESMTIVVHPEAGINSFEDLAGKKVNIGDPGSGVRSATDLLLNAFGWKYDKFALVSELKGSEVSAALCDKNIDAYTYVIGHPNAAIKEAATTCGAKIISLEGQVIDQLVNDYAYYTYETIPGGLYSGVDNDLSSFGMKATVVTSTKLSDEAAYNIVKTVFENFSTFKRLHPAFAHLKKEDMVKNGLSAPLHPGAVKYYKEVGLLK